MVYDDSWTAAAVYRSSPSHSSERQHKSGMVVTYTWYMVTAVQKQQYYMQCSPSHSVRGEISHTLMYLEVCIMYTTACCVVYTAGRGAGLDGVVRDRRKVCV